MTARNRDELLAANEEAADYYRRQLLGRNGEGPRDYLTRRGFAALLTDTPWTVGYAPASWTALHDHLSSLGYSDETQLAAGLTTTSSRGNPIDRFRDRITFGIRDERDCLVGFTARAAPEGLGPKYLNTPRTDLFDKSSTFLGLGEATRSPATTHVLVEGPLDAIAVHLADARRYAALAMCGTAITTRHIYAFKQLQPNQVILAFDGDDAGDRALENAITLIGNGRTRAVRHANQDPAALLASGGSARVARQLADARPAVQVLVDVYLHRWPDRRVNAEAGVGCLRETAAAICRAMPDDVASIARRLCTETGLEIATVTAELAYALGRSATRRWLDEGLGERRPHRDSRKDSPHATPASERTTDLGHLRWCAEELHAAASVHHSGTHASTSGGTPLPEPPEQ